MRKVHLHRGSSDTLDPVYLDHAATTPLRPEVRAAMEPLLGERFGNPSSVHRWGRAAAAALDEARAVCAGALGARASEIHFVRGGTESDNLAVLGSASRLRALGRAPTVVVSSVEHRAVLDAAREAVSHGGTLVVVPVAPDGSLDLDALDAALGRGGQVLVSVMWVNNETGALFPVAEVAERALAAGAVIHTDAVQGVGRVTVRVDEVPVHLLTLTGHKLGGPKGTGLLFAREGARPDPLLHGGGQERGLRPGTPDVAGAVGLAEALRLAVAERSEEEARLAGLRDSLERRLVGDVEGARVNCGAGPRAPHISSVSVPGVDGADLVMALDRAGLAVSGGAACASGGTGGSHVIAALHGADDPYATVRFSLGRDTKQGEVERAAAVVLSVVARLQERSRRGP